ncbi:hypothetical protein ACLOAU_14250 [Niabella sp. CJ426]|uniref:hypothetical protein n=1 Tax=Niabella sp. CJ426 TaxID=3393740 RepID=UPI003CFC3694
MNLLSKLLIVVFAVHLFSCNKTKDTILEKKYTSLDSLSVDIIKPSNLENTNPDSSLIFEAQLTGKYVTDYNGLKTVWRSDKDGVLAEGKIASERIFGKFRLSKNIHEITLSIYNELDSVIEAKIKIYNLINLYNIEKSANSNVLRWTSCNDLNFESFKVYRSETETFYDSELLYTTLSRSDTTFADTSIFLGRKYYYKVSVNLGGKESITLDSETRSIVAGIFITVDYPIAKIIVDKRRKYAYGLVRPKTLYDQNNNGYGIAFINLEKRTIERKTNVYFFDFDIDPSGDFLYACTGTNTIYKINLNTQATADIFNINSWVHKIEIGNNNRMYFHLTPPTSGGTRFGIYDLVNKKELTFLSTSTDFYNSYYSGDFELSDDNIIYHSESGITNAKVTKLGTTNDIFSILKQTVGTGYSSSIYYVNQRLFCGPSVFDRDLNLLGKFINDKNEVTIEAVSPDGSRAFGWGRIYNTTTFLPTRIVPAYYDIGAFSDNNTLILSKSENPFSYKDFTTNIYFYSF